MNLLKRLFSRQPKYHSIDEEVQHLIARIAYLTNGTAKVELSEGRGFESGSTQMRQRVVRDPRGVWWGWDPGGYWVKLPKE